MYLWINLNFEDLFIAYVARRNSNQWNRISVCFDPANVPPSKTVDIKGIYPQNTASLCFFLFFLESATAWCRVKVVCGLLMFNEVNWTFEVSNHRSNHHGPLHYIGSEPMLQGKSYEKGFFLCQTLLMRVRGVYWAFVVFLFYLT